MKTISIRDLHQNTGRYVRAAKVEPIQITDRGVSVAVMKAPVPAEMAGKVFPKRRLSSLPKVDVDSTDFISEERDAR